MAINKFYTKEKTIGKVNYIAQFNGLSAALTAVDNSYLDGSSNIGIGKFSKYIFENVIVEPKGLTADSFEDMTELNEVIAFGTEVMQGKFRAPEDKKSAK